MIMTKKDVLSTIKRVALEASFSRRYGTYSVADKFYFEKNGYGEVCGPKFAAFDIYGMKFDDIIHQVNGVPIYVYGRFWPEYKRKMKNNSDQSFICLDISGPTSNLFEVQTSRRFVYRILPII